METDKDKFKQFLLAIKEKTSITATELIEKDFYLNILLSKLNLSEYAFKGGTCLAKVYLNYFRFSEDLDFTFINQELWKGKSANSIKRVCKEKINEFGRQLEKIGMNFIFDKSDKKYFEVSNNNTLVTFKIYYASALTGMPSFIKVQINFLEKIIFGCEEKELVPLVKEEDFSKEDIIYYIDFLEFYKKIKVLVYDIKEIIAEKVRSLLTRKAIKSRDAIDLLFIYQKFKIKPRDLLSETKEKLLFSLNACAKYRERLLLSKERMKTIEFKYSEVSPLVITPFKKENFDDFIRELKSLLSEMLEN